MSTEPITTLPVIICLGSFLVTFVVTRVITRLIRSGRGPFKNNVTDGGLHVHHAVPGLILLLAGAIIALAADASLFRCIAGGLVGFGAALVLDEFALILYMKDVYWSREGRASVQIVALMAMCLGLAALGFVPLTTSDFDGGAAVAWTVGAILVVTVSCAVVCVRKGKFGLVLVSIFIPFLAWIGAIRLARPSSPWFKKYREGSKKYVRATRRAHRSSRLWRNNLSRIADLIAGSPTVPTEPDKLAVPRAPSHQLPHLPGR
ncbi:MAG: hypothetical protein ABI137_13915 [Antricoccus sp.]